jgi:hypothetical protein
MEIRALIEVRRTDLTLGHRGYFRPIFLPPPLGVIPGFGLPIGELQIPLAIP